MGRKNRRMEPQRDKRFEKFARTFMDEQYKKNCSSPSSTRKYSESELEFHRRQLEYAKQQLELNDIEYHVINETTTFMECRRGNSNSWIKYYASSGYIMGYPDFRGIKTLIMLLKEEI